jgi:hypothetical protein
MPALLPAAGNPDREPPFGDPILPLGGHRLAHPRTRTII